MRQSLPLLTVELKLAVNVNSMTMVSTIIRMPNMADIWLCTVASISTTTSKLMRDRGELVRKRKREDKI